VKPAVFDYIRVDHIEEALELLAQTGSDARILAGGQSLVAMLNMRLAQPAVLVDLMHVPGSDAVRIEKGRMVVPAAVRQANLAARPSLEQEVPLLAKVLPWVGHEQTRARGTVCGSIAHADPSAELLLALAALDGDVVLRSAQRRRVVAAADFVLGMMLTDRADDELIEALHFPLVAPDAGSAFREVGRRQGDFAIVACAAIVSGRRIRLAVGGVNDTPFVRDWDDLDSADTDAALNDLAWSLDARDDLHATARYRRELVRKLGRQTIDEARRCVD